jgi:16S rRNA (guanine(966)-N(2))-methyltransferase RsmD
MRVITGSARGHPLKVPKSASTRPTPARAKEAMFSSLGNRVPEARVLDLFAGSGAFGIEALSRGATEAVFVELDGMACSTLRDNLRSTHLEERAILMDMDVPGALAALAAQARVFDIIFADPPYLKSKAAAHPRKIEDWKKFLLASDDLKRVLAPNGVLLVEHYKQDGQVESTLFKPQKEFRFGDTLITLLAHV